MWALDALGEGVLQSCHVGMGGGGGSIIEPGVLHFNAGNVPFSPCFLHSHKALSLWRGSAKLPAPLIEVALWRNVTLTRC